MSEKAKDLSERLTEASLNVLGPLRLRKYIDHDALKDLKSVLEQVRLAVGHEEYVPRKLVGELWDIFCSILAEADHAQNPAPIRAEAWDIQERLRKIFGPTW